jgi:uncharacterized membrane protein
LIQLKRLLRALLVAMMALGAALVWAVPLGRHIFGLASTPVSAVLASLGLFALAVPVLVTLVEAVGRRHLPAADR